MFNCKSATSLYASARAARENLFMGSIITTVNRTFENYLKPLRESIICYH